MQIRIASLVAAVSFACSAGVSAQQAVGDPAETLPAMTVRGTADDGYAVRNALSATKIDTPLIDTPLSIQAVSQEVMQDQASRRLEDVLRNVSGVQAVHAYGGSNEMFVVRGFQQSPATHRNGVSAPLVTKVDLANVERVEVLKGPSAVTYGSSDPGGIVNIVTRMPSSTPAYEIEQELGSWNHARTRLGANIPLDSSGTLLFRMDAAHQDSETFRQLSEDRRTFIAPTLSWLPRPGTRVNLSLEYADNDFMYDSGIPAVGTSLAKIPRKRSFVQRGLGDDQRTKLADLNATHAINDQWKVSAGLLSFSSDRYVKDFYLYANLAPGDTDGSRQAWFGPETVHTRALWASAVGDLQSGNVRHKLLIGAEFAQTKFNSAATDQTVDTVNIYTFNPKASNAPIDAYLTSPPDFLTRQRHRNNGIFVQDQMQFSEHLHLLVGLRHDVLKRKGYSEYFGPYDNTRRTDSKTSPRLGITWKFDPTLSLYGSYSESFGPGFNFNADAVMDPEVARQYEIGLKTESVDGNFRASAALFDLTKKNIPTQHPTQPALTVSIGEANSRGMEIDAQGKLGNGLYLIANYALTDTEITKDNTGNQGNRLPYAPRHQANLWLKYAVTGNLSLGGGVYAASDRYGDAANSFKDAGFAKIDLFAAYRFKIEGKLLTAQLNLNNVTDETYYTLRNRWSNMPAAPRSVFLSLRADL